MTEQLPAPSSEVPLYFQNLNAIRFLAAALVIVHHIEQFKSLLHHPNNWHNPIILMIGDIGVILFFVLSGFLISYLLLKEEELTQTINLKNFYIRRVLRILPLYIFIIFSALIVIPQIKFLTIPGYETKMVWHYLSTKIMLYLFLLPNLIFSLYGLIPYASQTWSIGAEEQFYLIWPLLFKYVRSKLGFMLGVLFAYLSIKLFVLLFTSGHFYYTLFKSFVLAAPLSCMAIGGLLALMVQAENTFARLLKRILINSISQWLTFLITIVLIYNGFNILYFNQELYACLLGIILINFAIPRTRTFKLDWKWLDALGKTSYGLYLLHPLVIVFLIRCLELIGWLSDYILYPAVFFITIILAAISYIFFEKKFINQKAKFTVLTMGKKEMVS